MVGVPAVVHVSQLEKSWYRLCMSEMPICSKEKLSHQQVMEALL
jgi:hypothetical protein